MNIFKNTLSALSATISLNGSAAMAQDDAAVRDANDNGISDIYEETIDSCNGAGQITLYNGDVVINKAWEQGQLSGTDYLEMRARDGETLLCIIEGDDAPDVAAPSVEDGQFEFIESFSEVCVSLNGIWVDVFATKDGALLDIKTPITSVFQAVNDIDGTKMEGVEGICEYEQEYKDLRGNQNTRVVQAPIITLGEYNYIP